VIKRHTASSRFTRALQAMSRWCQFNRHRPVAEQHRVLSQKLRGHYNYYGITGNSAKLGGFFLEVTRIWYKWLRRRHRHRPGWTWFNRLLGRFPLPRPIAIHSIYRVANA